jgi:chemotaxis protein CheD
LDVMLAAGATRGNVVAKVAGGANVLFIGRECRHLRIGQRNAEAVLGSLAALEIPVVYEDVGGFEGRKIWINLRNFDLKTKKLLQYGGVA